MDTNFLDTFLPLRGASHADAVGYSVDVPMRYAECCVRLRDGRSARLKDARQFVGWSGMNGSRRLLFDTASGRILLPSLVERLGSMPQAALSGTEKFIARDGSLKFVRQESTEC